MNSLSELPSYDNLPVMFLEMKGKIDYLEATLKSVLSKLSQPQPEDKPAYMTIKQAAKYLNRAVQTVYNMASKSIVPHYKVNGRLMFKQADLDAYIQDGKVDIVNKDSD